jgi:hypothetical protein
MDMDFSLAERDAMRCIRNGQRSARAFRSVRRVAVSCRAVPQQHATTRATAMAFDEFLPFLGMCTLAVAVYSLACWVGCWF